MKGELLRHSAFILTDAMLAASPLAAATFQGWDTDFDGVVSRTEWTTGMEEEAAFADWGSDSNSMIGNAGFADGLFRNFDADGDRTLTTAEWDDGLDGWYGERAVDLTFDAWDTEALEKTVQARFGACFAEVAVTDATGEVLRGAEDRQVLAGLA